MRRYNRDAAAQARTDILASRSTFWRPADFDLPAATTQRTLLELVSAGELRRIRKGLYWRGVKTPLGMSPPSPDQWAAELTHGAGIGPSGLSAANTLRLSTQIPRRAEYAVPGRAPTSSPTVRFVSRASRSGRAEYGLSALDVAALEVLDEWENVLEAEPNEAMDRLTSLITSGDIDADRLSAAGNTEPAHAQTRLRYLLHRAGSPELAERLRKSSPRTEHRALSGLPIPPACDMLTVRASKC